MRLSIVGCVAVCIWASVGIAQDTVREFSWSELKKTGQLTVGKIEVERGQHEQLKIDFQDGWWTERDAGWIGGVGGCIVGLLGALIGILGGFGKARRFVMLLTTAVVGLGMLCLVVGAAAFALGQPYAVYYPLVLFGIIATAVFGGNLPILRRRYQQIELRRMTAMDSR